MKRTMPLAACPRRSSATGVRASCTQNASEGWGGAPLPDLPPRLPDLGLRMAHVAAVVGLVHLAGLCGERLQVHPIVGFDHDLQRVPHRGRAVVLLDRALGALGGGDVRAALEVVARDVHLVACEAVTQIDHALQRVVRVLALGVLLDHGLEGRERLACRAGRALGEIRAEQMLDQVRRAFEVHQALDVPGVVHARMRGVFAPEGLGGIGRGLAFPGAVICVDEIEPRLARFVAERIARRQLLVDLDGGVEVVGIQIVPGALVEQVGGRLLLRTHREREEKKPTPDLLYKRARHDLDSNDFNAAIKIYEQLTARYPFSDEARQSRLDLIYAYYRAGEGESATDAAETFRRENPKHPRVDYAWYIQGLVDFERTPNLIEHLFRADLTQRPPSTARKAFAAFKTVVEQYPKSEYAHDSLQRMIYLRNRLASYEVHVARYYFKRGAYIAAAQRAKGTIEQYDGAPAVREALQIMIESYDRLNLQPLAAQTRQVYEANYSADVRHAQAEIRKAWWKIW